MKSIYVSDLHKFVSTYLSLKGHEVVEQNENYFLVKHSDNTKAAYTYSARIASENRDMRLLAKGSQHLENMLRECSERASLSEAEAEYTFETVKRALKRNECCDLCPFFMVCDNKSTCCDFCPYNRYCNSVLLNADLLSMGDIISSRPIELIAFIFLVKISNDYSLSQKIEKYITVLIDSERMELLGTIKFGNLQNVLFKESPANTDLGAAEYTQFLTLARREAELVVKNQLEVFKKEIEDTLNNKIRSIIDKYEEEYADNYTKVSLKSLDKLQDEAVRLCEREIKGYAINCEYNLNNVMMLHTRRDHRKMIFKHHKTGREFKIDAQVFLDRVDIRCDECSGEIDLAYLCQNGHVLCKDCADICGACNITVCNICDDESSICSTCGELFCADCHSNCKSCNAIICPTHSYRCLTCGNNFCIDCYNICTVCGGSICQTHTHICQECKSTACADHIFTCGVCGAQNCGNHIHSCSMCGTLLCREHANISVYSSKVVCDEHKGICHECGDLFAADELVKCSACDVLLCPDHALECKYCQSKYCKDHIGLCNSCLSNYCSCTESKSCKLCREFFCPDCIDGNGYCTACANLSYIEKNNIMIRQAKSANRELDRFKVYSLGESGNRYVIYGKNLLRGNLYVLTRDFKLVSKRRISLMEILKTKLLR